MSEPQTFTDRIKQSSHPLALLFFLGFRIGAPVAYALGMFFIKSFILEFITVILLLAADFWNVKNISGRLLVGLRWWNETDDNGESIWVFETANPDRQINPVDSSIFWFWLYLTPFVWGVMGILAFLKLEFLSLILVIIGLTLTIINTMAFTRCDKFGKANDLASSVFGTVSGSMFGRLVPSFFRGTNYVSSFHQKILNTKRTMVRVITGSLVECDPSIRALILQIDSTEHDIVIQELDDTHLLIDKSKVDYVKTMLNKLLAANTYNPLDDEESNEH